MKQTCEFRIVEKFAARLFSRNEGHLLPSGLIRKIELSDDDPRISRIAELQRELNDRGESFFLGWQIHRRYSRRELDSAEALQLIVDGAFEPAGEECGTVYDDTDACASCGAGSRRLSPLIIDVRKARRHDVAKTIADEVVVSKRFVDVFTRQRITGVRFEPVYECNHIPLVASRSFREPALENKSAVIVEPTCVGSGMFGRPEDDRYRCPEGHLLGVGLLSELWVDAKSRGTDDIVATKQFIGVRRGLLRPRRCLMVSPKVGSILRSERMTGFTLEVAHLT